MRQRIATLMMVLILPVIVPAAAQELDPDRRAEIESRIEQAKERLNLTEEQVEQIKPIIKSSFEASMEILESHGIDLSIPQEERERPSFGELRALNKDMQKVRTESTAQMAEVLSDEQMAEFRKMQEERREQMRAEILGRR